MVVGTDFERGRSPEDRVAPPIQASRLYQLARSKDSAARAELGEAITSLFMTTELSLREQEIVSDILISMLRQAEKDLRRAIAERLAVIQNAPLRVILHLSSDEIDVARAVLEQSIVLEDMDLMLVIEMQKSAYWQSIARRHDLKMAVVRALVGTKDIDTALTLVQNEKAQIPEDSFRALVEMIPISNDLSRSLLDRADLPKELVSLIYTYAGRKIEKEQRASGEISDSIADVTHEFISAAEDDYTPTRLMVDAARILSVRGQLSINSMIQSLKNGQIASAMGQMMVFMDLDFKAVRTMMTDPTGEIMAAFCRIQQADKKLFLKMYLLTQKYRSGERLVDPMMLNRALMQFDQMTMESCVTRLSKLRMSS